MNFNKINEGFGSRVKTLLKKRNITQSRFGDDTDTHKGLISRYINGESPSGDFIMKVVAYFPDDVDYLFFGDESIGVGEESPKYGFTPSEIISQIEAKLNDLKKVLPQE